MNGSNSFTDWIKHNIESNKNLAERIKTKIKNSFEDFKAQFGSLKYDSHHIVPIMNGIMGDTMAEKGHDLLVNISFRHQSRDISVRQLAKVYDFSKKQGKVILMVHGLMNDESIWQAETYKAERLGTKIEKEEKATVLYIRYNTGLHISENGKLLNNLLQALLSSFPAINELTIIGHSMGGLVTRSACYYAKINKQNWLENLKKVFLIGVPNDGSY